MPFFLVWNMNLMMFFWQCFDDMLGPFDKNQVFFFGDDFVKTEVQQFMLVFQAISVNME